MYTLMRRLRAPGCRFGVAARPRWMRPCQGVGQLRKSGVRGGGCDARLGMRPWTTLYDSQDSERNWRSANRARAPRTKNTSTPSTQGNNTKRELGEATGHHYDSSASSRGRFSTGHLPDEETSAKSWRPNFFLHAINLLLASTPPFTWKEMALAQA